MKSYVRFFDFPRGYVMISAHTQCTVETITVSAFSAGEKSVEYRNIPYSTEAYNKLVKVAIKHGGRLDFHTSDMCTD